MADQARPVHNHGPYDGPGVRCPESLVGDCVRAELESLRAMVDLHTCPECGMLHRPGRNTICPHTIAAQRDRAEVERLTRELDEVRERERTSREALEQLIHAGRKFLAATTATEGKR